MESLSGRQRGIKWGVMAGIVGLLSAGLAAGWGQTSGGAKPVPPGVTAPGHPPMQVELTAPAGVKVALQGTKLTANRAKGQIMAEGEATLRVAQQIMIQAHGARVTLTSLGRHRGSRVVIEPMPTTVAEK